MLDKLLPPPTFVAWPDILLNVAIAFLFGIIISTIYRYTHKGISYSQSFVQTLVLLTFVISIVMMVIGSNIARAFSLVGALSIIRLRTVVKDTRDIAFIFCSLVIGMAAGSQRYATAIVGCIILNAIFIYLHLTGFGTHVPHNAFLRFSIRGHIGPNHPVTKLLKQFCGSFTLISAQDSGYGTAAVEYAYQLMIRNLNQNEQMLSELQGIEGVESISLTMQEELLEV